MQGKAYGKGSVCPSCEPGKVRIYSMRFCPYAERVLLVASAKDIPHEIVNINLQSKPEWLFNKNSEGKIPVLEQNGRHLAESLIISEYLDEMFPNNKLTSSDPYQKAQDKMLVEKLSKVINFVYTNETLLLNGDADKWEELYGRLEHWEDELTERGTPFLSGNKPGMVDLMVWPWFEKINQLIIAFDLDLLPETRLPTLIAWIKRMLADSAVQRCVQPAEFYKGYYESRTTGKTNYDFGL